MHTDDEQLRSAYQQLNDAIEQAPQLFTDPTPYTLPASSLTSAQSFAAQLSTLVEHPYGAQAIMSWYFTATACLARFLGNLCGAIHDPNFDTSQGLAATYHQLVPLRHHSASTLTLLPLHDEPIGQDTPTLASHFAELDDAAIAATATTWCNAAANLHDYAARLHNAASSVAHAGTHARTHALTHSADTFATSLAIHEWADGLEEFARRSETIAQRIDSFGATYATTRTQLADIAARRQEALEQPAFQTYTFPEAAFTSRVNQLLRGTYNPGIQQATLAGISFPLPQATHRKVKPGLTPHDYGYQPNTNPAANPAATPAAWPTPRTQSRDPYSPDLHNPVYDPKIREAYHNLFSENRAPDPLATDGRNCAFRRRNPEDVPTFRRREPSSNRILPKPGGIRGPIRHPDDPLYGTGR